MSDVGLGLFWASETPELILPIDDVTLVAPGGLVTDGETLLVADWATGNILQIDFDSEPLTTTVIASGLMNPEGLALDNDGNLVVVEWGAYRLSHINLSTGGP